MKNKHFYLMAAMGISVLGFCSCSDNDAPGIDSSVSASNAIRFAANTELASRAGDITTNTLKDFYVYAYTRTDGVPELFYGQCDRFQKR